MTTSLGDFHALVSDALGRGTSFDSVIPKRVEMAAGWIERNYTFQYMRTWKTLAIDPTAEFPYILSLYDLRAKAVSLLRKRSLAADGTVQYGRPIRQVSAESRETRPSGDPESFWLNGVSAIVLNSTPDEALTLEAHLVQYTSWGSGTTWTHWLLDNATELLLCRSLMALSVRARDPKLYEIYATELKLEIQSFNVAEEALQTSDSQQIWEPIEYAQSDPSLRSA